MPYSEFSNKKNVGAYRGPDRRDSMAYFPKIDIRLPLLAIVLIGVITAAFGVFFPGDFYRVLDRETFYLLSSLTLGVAGILSIIRWRLDGMARSFWYGVAGLIGLVPLLGFTADEGVASALLLATVASIAILSIWALRSEAVDMAPKFRLKLLATAAAWLLGLFIGISNDGPPREYKFAAVGLFVLLIGTLTYRRHKTEGSTNGLWFLPTLFAIGFAPLVALSEGLNIFRSQFGGPMRFTAAGFAIAGSYLELHFAASREKIKANANSAVLANQVEALATAEIASLSQLHEVRSRVLAIQGGVAAVSAGSDSNLNKAIMEEIERLKNLVAPVAPTAYGPFQVLQALRSTLLVAESALPVAFEIHEDLIAMGSPDDLAQVVHGLMSNASKYAPGSPIDVSAKRDGDHILIGVADRGPGVPRGQRDLIFEQGWRAGHEASEGCGLGLTIARALITKGGGDLWVTPRTGGGANFIVSLPRWQGLMSIDGSGAQSPRFELAHDAFTSSNNSTLQEIERQQGIRRLGGKP